MATKSQALDHLIDVLAGSDIPTTGTTAQRIMTLADMIEDGEISIGGGGRGTVALYEYPFVTAHVDTEANTATFTIPYADLMMDACDRIAADHGDVTYFVSVADGDVQLSTSGYNEDSGFAGTELVYLISGVYYCAPQTMDVEGYVWDDADERYVDDFGFIFSASDLAADGSLTLTVAVKEHIG